MNIDVTALKQIHAVFGPVISAIPAVIDSLNSASDLERAILIKRTELEKLNEAIQQTNDITNERVQNAQKLVADEQQRLAMVRQEVKDARAETAKLVADRKNELAQATAAAEERLSEVRALLAGVSATYEQKRLQAEREHAEKMLEYAAEIAEFETRRENAAKALEELKARLG